MLSRFPEKRSADEENHRLHSMLMMGKALYDLLQTG